MQLYYPVIFRDYPDTENTRPTYVVEDLSELTAELSETVELPVMIDWTPLNSYDLSSQKEVVRLYEKILAEAYSEATIKQYINGETLVEIWDQLTIPPRVRYAWESVHLKLGLARFQSHVKAG